MATKYASNHITSRKHHKNYFCAGQNDELSKVNMEAPGYQYSNLSLEEQIFEIHLDC